MTQKFRVLRHIGSDANTNPTFPFSSVLLHDGVWKAA